MPSSRFWSRPRTAAQRSRAKRRQEVRRGVLVVAMITVFAGVTALCALGRAWADVQAPVDYTKILPADLVKNTPKGKLVNPYKDTQADVVAEGGKFLLSYSCSGCHGGGGGGGMCPPPPPWQPLDRKSTRLNS